MTGRILDGDLVIGPAGPARVRLAHAAVDELSAPGQWCVVEYLDSGQTAIVHAEQLALAKREARPSQRTEGNDERDRDHRDRADRAAA